MTEWSYVKHGLWAVYLQILQVGFCKPNSEGTTRRKAPRLGARLSHGGFQSYLENIDRTQTTGPVRLGGLDGNTLPVAN